MNKLVIKELSKVMGSIFFHLPHRKLNKKDIELIKIKYLK